MRKIVADPFIPLDSVIETAGQWMDPLPEVLAKQPEHDLVMQPHRARIVAECREDQIVLGDDGQQRDSAGDAPECDSTVAGPKGMSSQPNPTGGTLGIPMSCQTDRMRAADSRDRTRFPDGDRPPTRCMRPNASRSPMVPMGVLPAGAQVSGEHEHAGAPGRPGLRIGEVPDGRAAEDSLLGGGARVVHAGWCVHLPLEEVVVVGAGYHLEQAARHDHPAVGVADVFAWTEQGPQC